MTNEIKRTTLNISDMETAASAAVKRALEARDQAGIELSGEQVNSVSGGATFYFRDPFIYGIKIDPFWFKPGMVTVNPVEIGGIQTKTIGG